MATSILSKSKSTSTSIGCWSCKQIVNAHDLVRVYGKSSHDMKNNSSVKICGFCLAGYRIPVLRPSSGRWEFGTVLSHNGSPSRIDEYRHQYELLFVNGSKEWVSVKADPYEAYAQHFDGVREAESCQRKLSENNSCGVQKPFGDPNNVAIDPTQLQDLYRQDSYPIDFAEAEILYHEFQQSSSFDSSEDLFFCEHPALKCVTGTAEVSFVDSPPRKKARFDISFNHIYNSPVNQRHSVVQTTTLDSPLDGHISSLSADSPTSTLSSSRIYSSTSSTTSSQRSARLWTPNEDKVLLDTIAENNNQLCWPKIAMRVPGRTGKQCRERFLNHLGPHLKQSGWSALEDATIFRLYSIYGSKWSKIVKFLPGRTDNGTKNRFHHLRRRFEKRMKAIPNSKELTMMIQKMGNSPSFRNLLPDWLVTRDIATRILKDSASANQSQKVTSGDGEYKFGPFDLVEENVGCDRCGLIVPSKETGTSICRQTGWCETCTGVSLAISGDLLRAIHWVREDKEIVK